MEGLSNQRRFAHDDQRSMSVKGITALAGVVLLLAVFQAPVPQVANAGPTIGQGICAVLTLGVCVAFWSYDPFSTAEPIPMTCTPPVPSGPPQFLRTPKGSAKYPFGGNCTHPDQPDISMKYRWEGSWTPAETDPNKPNASESIEITGYEPFIPDRTPGGKIYLFWTARCNYDPWLRPETSGGCRRMGEFIPPDLREKVTDLMHESFPRTKDLIPPQERQRWAKEYLRVNPPIASKFNPAATSFASPHEMFTITKPSNGERVMQGQLIVTAQAPKIGATPVTELEFRWLDAAQNQPYVNTFVVDTPKLLQGFPVPQPVTRGHTGRWEIRARSSGKAVPGPWSLPLPFQLVLTQPTQSQKRASPIQHSSPLPSSTITQPSPVPQTAPLPSSSVMQAPAPSSATTQMRRSSSMIMPRGVDEKAPGSETPQPAEPAKKP